MEITNLSIYFYLDCLQKELSTRTKQNPRYSLRAFARDLNVDHSQLSRILSEKRPLPLSLAKRVIARLALANQASNLFIESLLEDHRQRNFQEILKGPPA